MGIVGAVDSFTDDELVTENQRLMREKDRICDRQVKEPLARF